MRDQVNTWVIKRSDVAAGSRFIRWTSITTHRQKGGRCPFRLKGADDGAVLRRPLIPHHWPFVISATRGTSMETSWARFPHGKHYPWSIRGRGAEQGGQVGAQAAVGVRKSKPRPVVGRLKINNPSCKQKYLQKKYPSLREQCEGLFLALKGALLY